MATKVKDATVTDPAGIEWAARASSRWTGYVDAAEGDMRAAVRAWAEHPEPLPDFAALRSAHVTRDVFGRFVLDRDTGTLHDIANATAACNIDSVHNGTYFHFWHEAQEHAGDDNPCAECMT